MKIKKHKTLINMKKLIAILLLGSLLTGSNFKFMAFGGDNSESENTSATTALNGQVVDKNTGESLTGVKLNIKEEDVTAYTDFDGNFKIQGLQPGTYNVKTSYISYKDKLCRDITLNIDKQNQITIKMESIEE